MVFSRRYQGPSESAYTLCGYVSAAMSDPSRKVDFHQGSQAFTGVRWWVNPDIADIGVSYDVHIWRSMLYQSGGVEILAAPVEEDTIVGVVGGFFYDQPTNCDLVTITIDNFGIAPTNGFQIARKAVS